MIGKLLPVGLLVAGVGAGVGVGIVLSSKNDVKPDDEMASTDEKSSYDQKEAGEKQAEVEDKETAKNDKSEAFEYLKMTKHFIVPVVGEDEISALVTMNVSLETRPGISDAFYAIEPKLRDSFLQVLFDHANMGGFDGNFTHSDNLAALRQALLEVARQDLGDDVSRVLIMSVGRQDT